MDVCDNIQIRPNNNEPPAANVRVEVVRSKHNNKQSAARRTHLKARPIGAGPTKSADSSRFLHHKGLTMQAEFDSLKTFDFANSSVHLWVFKRSSTPAKYKAVHVPIDENLGAQLTAFIRSEIGRISEFSPYSYLSQTNENSCLGATATDTDFSLLKNQVDQPEPEHLVRGIRDLKGAEGYVVKFSNGGSTVYAVKRSTTSWKTAYPKKFINMVFANGELSAVEDNAFSIEKNFDFYCMGQSLFIANKRGFESALSYKTAYTSAFASLQSAPTFTALFTDMQPIIQYVGSNSIQLRRMAAIEQKGLYSQTNFIAKLMAVNSQRNWGINFDPANGRIIPCSQTAKVILQVLLDHRLVSEVTDNTYDVPDAVQV